MPIPSYPPTYPETYQLLRFAAGPAERHNTIYRVAGSPGWPYRFLNRRAINERCTIRLTHREVQSVAKVTVIFPAACDNELSTQLGGLLTCSKVTANNAQIVRLYQVQYRRACFVSVHCSAKLCSES